MATIKTYSTTKIDEKLQGKQTSGEPVYINNGKIDILNGIGAVDNKQVQKTAIASNGIVMANPASANDGFWLRTIGTSENDFEAEIGVGDDANLDKGIVFRGYLYQNSQVGYEVKVPKKSGTLALKSELDNHNHNDLYIQSLRGQSVSTSRTGYWAAMCNSVKDGNPVLPTSAGWWHVLSMDWMGEDKANWISQLALPTQDGDHLYYRKNKNSYVDIDQSSWIKVADFDDLNSKQDKLTSGTNIKTINNQSLLGSGNINIAGGSGSGIGELISIDMDDDSSRTYSLNTTNKKMFLLSGESSDLSGLTTTFKITAQNNEILIYDSHSGSSPFKFFLIVCPQEQFIIYRSSNKNQFVSGYVSSNVDFEFSRPTGQSTAVLLINGVCF